MDTPDQRHPTPIRVAGAFSWLQRTPVLPDETLSSWLVRVAFDQGSSPLSLAGGLWPRWRVWTLDVDRELPTPYAQTLAYRSGVSIELLRSMTFKPQLQALYERPLPATGRWPWLRGLGARNRRRKGGMQFCAICLHEGRRPYYRKSWRLAWHVACARHHRVLQDQCPACSAAVEYTRLGFEHADLASCASCLAPLGASTFDRPPACASVLQLQAEADQQLAAAQGGDDQAIDWFARLHFCLSLARACLRENFPAWASLARTLGLKDNDEIWGFGSVQLEDLPAMSRMKLLECAAKLLGLELSDWVTALRSAGVTRQGLASIAMTPIGLNTLGSQLPATQRAARTAKAMPRVAPAPVSPATVRRRWARLRSQYRNS